MSSIAEQLARKAYPQRRHAQQSFIRGFSARMGDLRAQGALIDNPAEDTGRAAAEAQLANMRSKLHAR